MVTLQDITEAYLSASNQEKTEFINAVLPELIKCNIFSSNEFKKAVDNALLTSQEVD